MRVGLGAEVGSIGESPPKLIADRRIEFLRLAKKLLAQDALPPVADKLRRAGLRRARNNIC